jgi:hypothetical protein
MYIQRTIEKTIKSASRGFPVLLLTGMRQVGKSRVMEHLAESGRTCVSLDEFRVRELAKKTRNGSFPELAADPKPGMPALTTEPQNCGLPRRNIPELFSCCTPITR